VSPTGALFQTVPCNLSIHARNYQNIVLFVFAKK